MALGSLGRRSSKHRSEQPEAGGPVGGDDELTSYLAALAPETVDTETTGSGSSFGNAQVYQLRLQLMANEQLRELAAERQTSPQALATEWVMQRLEWEARQRGMM
ncbi:MULTISPECIES: hypothetical protein [Actinosynnema]|uniref:Uncharacterized protein n=1 Tax=Actinosynnema pretiosum TaxID=42197 RepID=A0A290ZF77_9PSEU|nr:hypothetical protein [Actinosynnema pretiosum]ATE57623.1 hypothetical protein CNX65_33530 [Actinosynnema pretiosum]